MIKSRFLVLRLCVIVVSGFFGAQARFDCIKGVVTHSNNCDKDSPYDASCDYNTEYRVNCNETCEKAGSNEIWGTNYYTYDSSMCRSALHDFRISSWNTSQRTVSFVRTHEDRGEYHDTIRHGVESIRYGKLSYSKTGIFYFTSPRIKEPLVDITSLHRDFIFAKNTYSVQECHLPGRDNRFVHFSYHNTLKEGTPTPSGEKTTLTNHDFYKAIWNRGLRDLTHKDEVRRSIPGGVTCHLNNNDLSVITSMTMRNDASFIPARLTVTGNVGEQLTLSMKEAHSCYTNFGFTWRKDAKEINIFQDFTLETVGFSYNLRYDSLVEGHAGVYSLECINYQRNTKGERFDRRGVVRLIVRSCPANLFGDHCNVSCPVCQNGGICHDLLGVCICPPGFKGSNCETPCGSNRFGADCSKKCSDTDPTGSETCLGLLFCLPDPYGCSCATGFRGFDCKSSCEPGKYGAGCTQQRECHCAEEQPCDIFTGLCSEGCEEGWKDSACVTSYPFLSSGPKLVFAKPMRLDLSVQAWDGTSGKGNPATYIVEMKEPAAVGSFHEVHSFDATTLMYPDYKNVSIMNLTPNTEYACRVIIVDVDGHAQRNVTSIVHRTACGKPKVPPYDLNVTSPDSSTVLLSWKNPDPETFQCPNVSVVVSYNSSQENCFENTTKEDFKFRSKPFTTWAIAIKIQTENGKSSEWAFFPNITTAEDAPEVPRSLNTYFDEPTKSIFANWTKPLERNGILRSYSVKLVHSNWQHSCFVPVPTVAFNVSSDINSAVFNSTDFKFSSSYLVYVAAITVIKGHELMKVINTPESIPEAAPRNLSVDYIGETSCSLRWKPPDCVYSNGKIDKYNVSVTGREDWASNTVSRSSVINNAQLSDLIPFTKYDVTVVACTSQGCGKPSINTTFVTLSSKPGQPRNLTVFSATTESLSITWMSPFPPMSKVVEYQISYEKQNSHQSSPTVHETREVRNLACKNSQLRLNQLCHTIINLEAKIDYNIWVIAVDDKGRKSHQGAYALGRTEEFKPEAPHKLKLENRTSTSLFISWLEPVKANGHLIKYRINVTLINLYGRNFIDGQAVYSIVEDNPDVQLLNITELEPASIYNVTVEAATRAGYGPPVYELFYTRASVPEVNVLPEVGIITKNSVQLLIKPIDNYKGPISAYFVLVKDVTNKRVKRAALQFRTYNQSKVEYVAAKMVASKLPPEGVKLTVGDGEYYDEFYNAPLQNGHKYIFGTAVLSEVDGEQQIGFSYLNEEVYVTEKLPPPETDQTGIIIAIVLAVILIFVVFGLILYYKKPELFYAIKGKSTGSFSMKKPKTGSRLKAEDCLTNSNADMHIYDECLVTNSLIKTNQIHVNDLEAYVQEAHTTYKISQEFTTAIKGIIHPSKIGKLAGNKSKNRYPTLVPYDHSRVKLEKIQDDKYSDYINANYVQSYKGDSKFIATQGPMPLTVTDFWRMIWQENTCKIIMVTNLVEDGKIKCLKYWPDEVVKYGQLTVKLAETVTFANYVIRTLVLSKDGSEREIKQFHFTTWPDHWVPAYPVLITTFLKQIRNYKKDSESPIVVHCSTGIGRTGTIILLANMIEMAKDTNTVDLQHGLWSLRQCRINLVENLAQYVFVYQALVDHLFSGETSLACSEFRKIYDAIIRGNNEIPPLAQNQFERLQRLCPQIKLTDCEIADEPGNAHKNRVAYILPTDRARAILPVNEADLNDYINAVFINGFTQNKAFVATQLPLPATINDFWRLVHSNKITSIVLLHELNPNDSTCPRYWKEVATETYGSVEVNHVESEIQGTALVRTFRIRDVNLKDEEMIVKQFHLQNWVSSKDVPDTADCILELIEMVERWQKNKGARTTLVQCLNGSDGCGIFCASVFMLDKIKSEQEVDVYLAVRCVRTNRPQFVTNLSQYVFLHKVAIMYLNSFETYANFQ